MTLKLTPYFKTNGNAKELIKFYQSVLDAQLIHIQTYGDLPIPFPDEFKENVAHAIVKVGDNLTINISLDNIEKAKRIFDGLRQDGTIISPLEATPFSPAFGTVTDKFGTTFTITAES
ncbi:VOC family protein [Oceanobacillus kimchii]|uniref:VOC family protein n=1 Tax=Oceanobacillus kimchii TaxID=746691 RepID=A0ABQ5TMG4_9BACI|nr:VOC family protein [Oceanobacillus kimchii]GLO68004.1 VOC family protein [Oceanobacillus kimchii]